MDLNGIMGIAQKMGMDKGKLNQVLKMANDYGVVQGGNLSGSKEKLKGIINDNGGNSVIDEALKAYDKPIVKLGVNKLLNFLGIASPESTIKGAANEVKGLIGEPVNAPQTADMKPITNTTNLSQRLAKLK